MASVAPFRLDFGPHSVVNGVAVDLTVYCGSDWQITVPFVAADGVTAVNVSSPLMTVRVSQDKTSTLLITPTLSASTNTVTITIPGSVSKLLNTTSGFYDLFATRADTSGPIKLLYGQVTIVPQTTTT